MKENRFTKGFLAGLLCTVIVIAAAALVSEFSRGNHAADPSSFENGEETAEGGKDAAPFSLLQAYLDKYYCLDYDKDAMELAAKKAYIAGLGDPYSVFLTAEEFDEMMEDADGAYCGVGMEAVQLKDAPEIIVNRVFRNSPAMEAGLQPGDILKKADETDLTALSLADAVSLIRGEEGTFVNLTVFRASAGETLQFRLERRPVEEDTVDYRMLQDGIGYILLYGFEEVSPHQMQQAIDALKEQGMQKLVLDLRGNPGGLLTSVLGITGIFLENGRQIFYMQDKNGTIFTYNASGQYHYDGKMAVLVNGLSASASEVCSGALKDQGRAAVIGTQTFGKGIVQSFYVLPDQTALKLTTHYYHTPSGAAIHGVGITPDTVISDDPATEEDEVLEEAIRQLLSEK